MDNSNEKSYIVYMHVFPNNKKYIGITSNSVERRWDYGRGYINSKYFYNAIKKYGWNNIQHIILNENLTQIEAEQMEIKLIELYDTTNREYGYNLQSGGSVNYKHSEETKEKIRQMRIGDKNPMYGSNGGFFGKHHSEDTKKKIKQLMSGENSPLYGKRGYDSHNGKIVSQYDINGNFIAEYGSTLDAYRKTGIPSCGIVNCCANRQKTSHGFIWRYVNVDNG